MNIDFNDIKANEIKEFKGGMKSLLMKKFEDSSAKIMNLTLPAGASIGLHTHTEDMEIIYVISGKGYAVCDGAKEELLSGKVHYCPKNSSHTVVNSGGEDLVLFATVAKC